MVFRSKQTLEAWLDEFRDSREGGTLINVLVQDGADGADTGLVIVPLRDGSAEIYMQPAELGSAEWRVTISASSETLDLTSSQLQGLAAELAIAASLCQFLQEKSIGHDEGIGETAS